ncbi:MAG: amidohydrolase family protein [Eubacteriaceae bacterium]|nr:amidohydrolase family protein [Eubacteriaceae bacterium]MCR4893323.1 amidohydrolase family protein [Eubacteriales bacterium]
MIDNRFKVTDMHTHVYPEKIAAKAVAGTDKFYGTVSFGTGVTDHLVEVGKAAGTDHFLIHSVATTSHQVSSINRFIASEAQRFDCVSGFGTLYPEGDVEADTDEIISLGMKGVKLHPEIQGFRVDEPSFVSMLRICERKGLTVLMHTGDTRYDCSNPNRLRPLLEDLSSLTVIGAHFGGWSNWLSAVNELRYLPNFFVDVSSSLYYISPEEASDIIHEYGVERVMYGTDYPMWDPAVEIGRFMKIPLSDTERRLILHDNAERILGIG